MSVDPTNDLSRRVVELYQLGVNSIERGDSDAAYSHTAAFDKWIRSLSDTEAKEALLPLIHSDSTDEVRVMAASYLYPHMPDLALPVLERIAAIGSGMAAINADLFVRYNTP